MKIVINDCYGGFGLSHKAIMRYAELKEIKLYVEKEPYMYHYYKVPPEQYHECSEKWHKEDGNYGRINAMDWYFSDKDVSRDDPILIQVIEELKDEANGMCAKLKIIEIPDGTNWEIEEYDGQEWVSEKHETWG